MKNTQNPIIQISMALCALIIVGMACSLFIPATPTAAVETPEQGKGSGNIISSDTASGEQPDAPDDPDGQPPGFRFNLSEGAAQPDEFEPVNRVTGELLSKDAIRRVLSRLPALAVDEGLQMDFKLPAESLPPPRTGETIPEVFPPEVQYEPQDVPEGPLHVLRYSPEGEIPLAPFVNITFNQPMVPLATLAQLAEMDMPVIIEPELPGTWRWLGTKTLNFQYDSELIDRLPMATEYTVSIPAGTESQTGGTLADAVQFRFSTPTVTLVNSYPYSYAPQPLEPLFFAHFNQRIDAAAVLETIKVDAEGRQMALRLATEEEIAADSTVRYLAENAQEGRWLAFRATEALTADTYVAVTIGPKTPSTEGPLLTESIQSYGFNTYAPLQIVEHGCSYWEEICRPLQSFFIEFNNPLDLEHFDESLLRVEPELPGMVINAVGNIINIRGASQGQTTYKVTVDGDLLDEFGQRLGEEEQLRFKVGSAEPFLIGPDELFVTLDPSSSDPALSLYTMNYNRLDLQVYAVEPRDWPDFLLYLQEYYETDKPGSPPGEKVVDRTHRFDSGSDMLTEVPIEFSEIMDGEFGHFVVVARPPAGLFKPERYWETVHAWVQITQIGLDAFVDHSEMVVWATSLADGSPLPEVRIGADTPELQHFSDETGLARFLIPASGATYLTATQGGDTAMLPNSTWYWGEDAWFPRHVSDDLRWYVYDDRQMYKPGEEVHLKGWLRRVGGVQDGDVELLGSSAESFFYALYGPQGNELATGSANISELGGFDFMLTLPENANLGYAQLYLTAQGSLENLNSREYYHQIQIQEFRRPEFEVAARNETSGPYFVGDHAIVAVEAKYFAGGPLPNAETTWWVSATPGSYSPPNWPDFTFGTWTPWWWYHYEGGDYEEQASETFESRTDPGGEHFLRVDFPSAGDPQPYSILAESSVMDVNRQAWASATSLLVHPADLYVGLRSERYFVERGIPLEIEFIVTDLDGVPVPERTIDVQAARLEWKFTEGSWGLNEVDVQECALKSAEEALSCTFETPIGGRYQITASITDEQGRRNQSRLTRWVSGGELAPSREVEQEEAVLIPDRDAYQPGDVAEILVQSPFSPAEGLLTVNRSGLLYTESFTIEAGESTITLQVPIEEAHIPNLHVQVELVGSSPRIDDLGEVVPDAPARPAYASGYLTLSIPPLQRILELTLNPAETELEPGAETQLSLTLSDAHGNPVADAELAVVVVDEAILALTHYNLSDPITSFYQQRSSGLSSYHGRSSIILIDPLALAEAAQSGEDIVGNAAAEKSEGLLDGFAQEASPSAPMEMEEEAMMEMADSDAPESRSAVDNLVEAGGAISVRSDFNPLATFAPEVRTDANGQAVVEITLPDNLTRYRIMVVAVDPAGDKFGSAEANLTARLPLMVRPSAPRFLNFGDSFELPIVLQNQTDEVIEAEVVIQAANLNLDETQGLLVSIPANDRVEVRFPASTDMAGTAQFQIAAVSGDYVDAAEVELPVYTPATTEAFATYGVVDEGAAVQPVLPPQDVFPQFGGLEIQTSSTALQALTDAVIYLVKYPYECSEQLSSRILGVAALRDVLTAFEAEGLPTPEDMEAAVRRDIERLQGMQNWDGGFPYWRRGQESIPFNTIHVAHALVRAGLKGFEVPSNLSDNLLYYLQDIENHYPWWYSQRTRWILSSYALYVRDLMDDNDSVKARGIYNDAGPDELSLEAIGWLWQVMLDDSASAAELDDIRLYVGNRVVETAGAANFTTYYDDQSYLLLSSNRRTDAVLLDALIADDPDSDLIPKLVNGLLAHRKRGRWGNTQENVFILLALDRYFNTFESQTPDFVARIWLGETYAGEHVYSGYSTERHATQIPMQYLVDAEGAQDLILSKDGVGRLYYRLGLSYAPTDLWLDPLDMGFVVVREYEAIDDPEDVTRDEDGVWHIKAGARVRVRITMIADNRRYHVALVDRLPAGLEIINPALAVSESIPQDPDSQESSYGWWWWGPWYEHQNLRDERAEAFASLLWDGVFEYTYIARATTPGTFVVPPAKAEEMYSPEVFGRSASDWVIVE
jgi:alpha-2-macroglobulin